MNHFDHFLVHDDGQETHAYACFEDGSQVEIPLDGMEAWYEQNVANLVNPE
jgi:hypothetical protein